MHHCQGAWINRTDLRDPEQGIPASKSPGFYIPSMFFTSSNISASVYKIPTREGYVSANSLKYLSTFLPRVKDSYIRCIRIVNNFLEAICRAAETGTTFSFASPTYVDVQKEYIKNGLVEVFLGNRSFLNNFDLFCRSEQYVAPRAGDYYGSFRFRYLPGASQENMYSPEITFLGTLSNSSWFNRGFNNLIGDLNRLENSLDFVSYQMTEEDAFRAMVRLLLGLPVNLTDKLVIVLSKDVFKEAMGIRVPDNPAVGTVIRNRGINSTSAGLVFLNQAAVYMGVVPAKALKNFRRDQPFAFWCKNDEYGDIGFPIHVSDTKAVKTTFPAIPENEFNTTVELPPSIKERKAVIINKILESVDYGMRITSVSLKNASPNKIQEVKELKKQQLLKTLTFRGTLTEEVIETRSAEEIGEFISPEELAEISAFINEGEQQEPLPDVPDLDMEEEEEDVTPDTREEIAAIIREQEEIRRAESLRQTLRNSPIMSAEIPAAEPQVSPFTSEEIRQLDELAQQSSELLRQVPRAEELFIPRPSSHRGGAIVTGTPGGPFEPISIREYRADGEVTHVWVNPPNAYVGGVDPAVQQEQPVMVDTPSEAETQGETQLPI